PGPFSPANYAIIPPIGIEEENILQVYQSINNSAKMSPIAGFIPNTENIAEQLLQLQEIYREFNRVWLEERDNLDIAWLEANEKMKAAGVDEVLAELNSQLAHWWENR